MIWTLKDIPKLSFLKVKLRFNPFYSSLIFSPKHVRTETEKRHKLFQEV